MALPEELSEVLSEDLTVTFSPPLFLQRQIWVLDILRRESVVSVLDIGCGEGSLLQCLTEPSYSLPPTMTLPLTSPFVLGATASRHLDLHLHAIHGLDPSAQILEFAIQGTAPPPPDKPSFTGYERWVRRNARWMHLEVNIWEGGFEAINDSFAGDKIDTFVASEVIEHLTPELFPLFAPILLGHYRPRLLLLTTPNYSYNQRFSPPGKYSPTGYPDPTGRTNRVFRYVCLCVSMRDFCKKISHSDHKFEWTTEEWTAFCTESALKFGYAVEIGGIGHAIEPDPWNREDNLGPASHTALFRRLNSSAPQPGCLDGINTAATPQLVLRARHIHKPHPLSLEELAIPSNSDEVLEAVKEAMTDNFKSTLTFNELWSHGELSLKCKGDVGRLVRVFDVSRLDPDTWLVENETEAWETKVTWRKFVAIAASEPVACESNPGNESPLGHSLEADEVVEEWVSTTGTFPEEDDGDDKRSNLTNVLWGADSGEGESIGWHDTNAQAWGSTGDRPWLNS